MTRLYHKSEQRLKVERHYEEEKDQQLRFKSKLTRNLTASKSIKL